jgi:hypothetical protein
MNKKIYILLFGSAIAFSCKKQNLQGYNMQQSIKKYDCVCNTTISFTDQCGTETRLDTDVIYSAKKTEASGICSALSTQVSDTRTISSKNCILY